MKILFLIILFSISFLGAKTGEVDFEHGTLLKALKKTNGSSELQELSVPESVDTNLNGQGKYFQVSGNSKENEIAYVYVGRVHSCRAGGCSAPGTEVNTGFEYFDYFILYSTEGKVEQVKVFNYQATHGQEITIKGWLRQFQDHRATDSLNVGKQIDGIAGATISVYAITDDIRQKTKLLKQIIDVQYSVR